MNDKDKRMKKLNAFTWGSQAKSCQATSGINAWTRMTNDNNQGLLKH